MIDFVTLVSDLDSNSDLHIGRLLVLMLAFADKTNEPIEGLTKLAKLDFLLRYPVMLERALSAKGHSIKSVELQVHERLSVESQMVRYRFGPWDHRYRDYLNILIGKQLIIVSIEGRTVVISLTPEGEKCASELANTDEFADYARRAVLLKRHFDLKGTTLMRFIYETFPEVVSLRSNRTISL